MKELYQKLLARIDALNPREQLVVFAAGIAVLGLTWYVMFAEPAINARERVAAELAAAQTELVDVQARIEQQASQAGTAGNAQQRLEELRRRAASVDGKIQNYAAELISPTEMARLLERVLERRPVLELRRLRNLGAEDMLPEGSPGQSRLYRHGLELELEGPYLAVLAYLEDLEALPWRLYWQVLEIDADEYPGNRVRIEVATLSLHEEWIGV